MRRAGVLTPPLTAPRVPLVGTPAWFAWAFAQLDDLHYANRLLRLRLDALERRVRLADADQAADGAARRE